MMPAALRRISTSPVFMSLLTRGTSSMSLPSTWYSVDSSSAMSKCMFTFVLLCDDVLISFVRIAVCRETQFCSPVDLTKGADRWNTRYWAFPRFWESSKRCGPTWCPPCVRPRRLSRIFVSSNHCNTASLNTDGIQVTMFDW